MSKASEVVASLIESIIDLGEPCPACDSICPGLRLRNKVLEYYCLCGWTRKNCDMPTAADGDIVIYQEAQ